MKFSVDRDLINDQMSTLGLSERAAVAATGIPYMTFREIRIEGQLQATLTLRHLYLLSQALGLTMADLVTPPHNKTDGDTDHDAARDAHKDVPQGAARDAEHLIPLLLELTKRVAFDELARALEWDRERTRAALDAIPAQLSGTGMRLHDSGTHLKIIPAARVDKRTKRALGRLRATTSGLTAHDARTLTRIIQGHNALDRSPSNATRISVGTLKNMGCVALNNNNAIYEPTYALRLAFPDL